MPQSTTIENAKSMSITFDGTDMCGTTQMLDWDDSREVAAFFTACGDGARHLTGKRTISGTLTIYYSETGGEAFKTLIAAYENNTEGTLVASPLGGDSGEEQWSMTILLTGFPLSLDPGSADPITIAVPFVVQGIPTRATVS